MEALTTRLADAEGSLVEATARVEAEKENYRREKFWNRDHRDRLEGEIAALKRLVSKANEQRNRSLHTYTLPTHTHTHTHTHTPPHHTSALEEEKSKTKHTPCESLGRALMESVGATQDVTPGAIEFERVVRELKEKLAESEGARRKLHNQIQDLKVCLHVMSRLTDPHVVIIIGHRLRSPPPSLSLFSLCTRPSP